LDSSSPEHHTVTALNPEGGPTLMGELGKIVPHSPMRFSGLVYSKTEAVVKVAGVKVRSL